jgi:hypothetical protein
MGPALAPYNSDVRGRGITNGGEGRRRLALWPGLRASFARPFVGQTILFNQRTSYLERSWRSFVTF